MNRSTWAAGALTAAMLAPAVLLASSASAAPGDRAGAYSTWTTDATATPVSVAVAPGFPSATVTSDDPALATSPLIEVAAGTPPGAIYGTSSGSEHLSLSPLDAGGGAWIPTTTTLTFESPTPDYGWSIIVGDVDNESLVITANGVAGPVSPADLGFSGAFGSSAPPAWDATTSTLATAAADDTANSHAWFSPTAALTSISISTVQRQDAPTAHLWLAAQTASLAGTVTDTDGAPVAGATVTLATPDGAPLAGVDPAGSPIVTDSGGAFETFVFPAPTLVTATTADGIVSPGVLATPEEVPVGYADFYVFPAAVVVPVDATPPPPVLPGEPAPPAVLPEATLPVMGGDAMLAAASAGLMLLAGLGGLLVSRQARRSARPSAAPTGSR
jgi:hypothetical protein